MQPSFRNLGSGRLGLTLVAVQRDTDIRLLIDLRHRRTTTTLGFIGRSFRLSCPGVEENMEILLVGIVTRTLDPHRDGVRTVAEVDTSDRTGCRRTGVQTADVLPCITEGEIARAHLRDTHGTYLFVLHLHGVTGTTRLARSEVEIKAHLGHIGTMPVLRLDFSVKSSTGPVLKMRIRELIILRHGQQRHCHYRQTGCKTLQKCTHINIIINYITFSGVKRAHFLSSAKLLLFCQVHNSVYYEKVYDY